LSEKYSPQIKILGADSHRSKIKGNSNSPLQPMHN